MPERSESTTDEEGVCEPDASVDVIDLLGVYYSRENLVVIYVKRVMHCAAELGIDPRDLMFIVLTHELAHAITHRGLDHEHRIWESFDAHPPAIKEYFAQIYTYKFWDSNDNKRVKDVLDLLADTQPEIYKTYRDSKDKTMAEVNAELMQARRQLPDSIAWYFNSPNINDLSKSLLEIIASTEFGRAECLEAFAKIFAVHSIASTMDSHGEKINGYIQIGKIFNQRDEDLEVALKEFIRMCRELRLTGGRDPN